MEFERGREGFEFDLVDNKTRDQFLRRRWSIAWSCIGAFALILFILVIVALAKPEKSCSNGTSVSSVASASAEAPLAYHCLYALGGGMVNHESLAFPQLKRAECGSTFEKYFANDGQYWKDLDIALNDAKTYFNNKAISSEVRTTESREYIEIVINLLLPGWRCVLCSNLQMFAFCCGPCR